ncbi:MAG: A/G-specific adenine glycosylase [Anaerolineales bacterium]|nr:A/G-specific adenine glycosylase [Anaerolineales bacterium]
MSLPDLATPLLAWYAAHGRTLPWRGARDPYRVWIAEIMLQQTQVETVKPYYARWLKRFPTVHALAAAPQQEVLALWEGLGYYSRARNLHRAAQTVAAEHAGRLPRTVAELLALPGIGRYTAAAIASIAFGVDAAVLDGNVKRVLARVFDYAEDVKSPRGERDLQALAERLLPAGRAGDYNQALMDLGATVCTPRAPACERCPVLELCQARARGRELQRPVVKPRAPTPHHTLAVAVIHKLGRVLLVQRPAAELLGGLWAFPTARVEAGSLAVPQALGQTVRADYALEIAVQAPFTQVRHAYTHFRVTAQAFNCLWAAGRPVPARAGVQVKWVRVAALAEYPMGKVDRRIAQALVAAP